MRGAVWESVTSIDSPCVDGSSPSHGSMSVIAQLVEQRNSPSSFFSSRTVKLKRLGEISENRDSTFTSCRETNRSDTFRREGRRDACYERASCDLGNEQQEAI